MNVFQFLSKARPGAFLVAATLGLAACGDGAADNNGEAGDTTATNPGATTMQMAEANLTGTGGDTTVGGTVLFEAQEDGKVKMTLDITVEKMAGKSVAAHIHEHSDCGNHGTHAGGHWNPTGENHGKWGQEPFHSGDFGNIDLDNSGKGHLELTSDRWSIGGESKTNVVNKAVIIHSGKDDYTSQPSGDSGARIGCGLINTRS